MINRRLFTAVILATYVFMYALTASAQNCEEGFFVISCGMLDGSCGATVYQGDGGLVWLYENQYGACSPGYCSFSGGTYWTVDFAYECDDELSFGYVGACY